MAELVEYGLVILASAFIVAFSVVGYDSYASSVGDATQRADYSSFVTLAYAAMEQGNSSASLTLENTTLACHDGLLSYGSPTLSTEDSLPVGCQFEYPDLNGPHELSFAFADNTLELKVG